MTSIMGFMVIQEDGTQVYSYLSDALEDVAQNLLPSLLSVLQMLSRDLLKSSERSEIKSITLTDTVYTIRNLDVHTPSRKQNRFYFVLLTDLTKKTSILEDVLEYLTISFLGYNKGEYLVKLRISATYQDEFDEFSEFLSPLLGKKIEDIKKSRALPPPSSFIQGMLNSLSEYIPPKQIVQWNKKLISLGQTYVWVSEDLTKKEEGQILEKMKETLSTGLYNTLVDRVNNQLNSQT